MPLIWFFFLRKTLIKLINKVFWPFCKISKFFRNDAGKSKNFLIRHFKELLDTKNWTLTFNQNHSKKVSWSRFSLYVALVKSTQYKKLARNALRFTYILYNWYYCYAEGIICIKDHKIHIRNLQLQNLYRQKLLIELKDIFTHLKFSHMSPKLVQT